MLMRQAFLQKFIEQNYGQVLTTIPFVFTAGNPLLVGLVAYQNFCVTPQGLPHTYVAST